MELYDLINCAMCNVFQSYLEIKQLITVKEQRKNQQQYWK